ncbi:MAG: type secretion system secreted protein VgrG [Acidobacteriota bacterium]|nr:type secretion system secreted protein VgrG [Acidobacteriota bacterium]
MTHKYFTFAAGVALAILLGAASFLPLVPATSAQSGVPRGTTTTYAVLAASAVTSTGLSVVNGDLGISPGAALTGFPPGVITGATHLGDPVAAQAQADAHTEYAYLDGLTCNTDLTGVDLGGKTLTPGVYCFASSAQLTGTLTLDAQGSCDALFVFQTGSTLTTSVGSSVNVINNPCSENCRGGSNVFWQVGSSATIGTGSQFTGNILANISATLNFGASVAGSVFALTGAVTMDTNNVSACGVNVPTPTPTVSPSPTASPTPTITCAPKVTGGGQIPVPNPDSNNQFATGTGRATFGFNSQPEKDCTDGAAKGHFNYVNHVTGLHVDGKVLNSVLIAPNIVLFSGDCGAGCSFTVTVQDNGEPGTLDTFSLSVTGTKNESRSTRVISRGNIQFHF